MSSVSLFIPFALVSHTAEFIKNVIENKARLGKVAQVDVVTKMNSTRNKYNLAYVYFERWNDDEPTKQFLADLKSSKKPIIRFDKDSGDPKSMCPTYWNVVENILVDKRRTTPLPLNSYDEFPVLGTPPRKVRFITTPPRALSNAPHPHAPRKVKVSSCIRNLNKEQVVSEIDQEHENDATMNLVDTGYVSQLEEENKRLREYIQSVDSEKYMMQQAIDRLSKMMHSMIASGNSRV